MIRRAPRRGRLTPIFTFLCCSLGLLLSQCLLPEFDKSPNPQRVDDEPDDEDGGTGDDDTTDDDNADDTAADDDVDDDTEDDDTATDDDVADDDVDDDTEDDDTATDDDVADDDVADDDVDDDDTQGTGGMAGQGGQGGTPAGGVGGQGPDCSSPDPDPVLGCPCANDGERVCLDAAQKERLQCTDGEWTSDMACSASENCDQRDGSCQPIVAECADQFDGFTFCDPEDSNTTVRCGPDLVSTNRQDCGEQVCEDGACVAPGCSPGCFCLDGACADMTKVVVGEQHECALSDGGNLWCWGSNLFGQTGQPGFDENTGVELVDEIDSVVDVDVGRSSTCAVLADGTVWCWGSGQFGTLGDGTPTVHQTVSPTQVLSGETDPLTDAVEIVSGLLHHCVRRSVDGSVWCWGRGVNGALGNDEEQDRTVAVPVVTNQGPLLGASRLGTAYTTTYAFASGTWQSWGLGSTGQTGRSQNPPQNLEDALLAASMDTNVNFVRVDGGELLTCGLGSDRFVSCWGTGPGIQFVDPAAEHITVPTLFTGLPAADDVAVGYGHACLIVEERVRCWGENNRNQLGDGSGNDSLDAVVDVLNVMGAVQIDAGLHETCALTASDTVYCWGSEFGTQPVRQDPIQD